MCNLLPMAARDQAVPAQPLALFRAGTAVLAGTLAVVLVQVPA